AEETAVEVVNLLQSCNLMRKDIKISNGNKIMYFVTDAPEKFKKIGNRFLKEDIEYVEWIDIPINI
ncbi:MAG: glutamate racemase, partial [Candidatus Hydrogenedens sp.]